MATIAPPPTATQAGRTPPGAAPAGAAPAGAEDEITISFVDAANRVIDHKWLIVLATILGLAMGVLLVSFKKPYYLAVAQFLPPKTSDLNTATSGGLFLTGDDTVDIYLGLLTSRTVQNDVIQHLDLLKAYHVPDAESARGLLSRDASFGVTKNAIITVAAQAEDPKLAAAIANEYMEALYRMNGEMVASSSSHRRAFFEQQLEEQKNALSEAETDLKNTQVRTGVVLPGAEEQVGLSATAQLQAELGSAQAKLAQLEVTGTDRNPEVVQARTLVSQIEGQLARQVAAQGSKGHGIAANNEMPGLQLEIAEKEREVKLREGLYDSLVQQYERARLASIDPGPQLQVIEDAIPPSHKAGPSRKNYALVGALLGFFGSLALLLLTAPVRHFSRLFRRARQERIRSLAR